MNPPSSEVIVLSETSSDGEASAAAAAAAVRDRQRRKCSSIAPIFLRRSLHGRMKPSREVKEADNPAAPPPRSPDCADVCLHSWLSETRTASAASPGSGQRRGSDRLQRDISQQHVREKRKRLSEVSPRVPKRQSLADGSGHRHLSAEDVRSSAVPPVRQQQQPRSGRLSRSRRLKVQSQISAGLVSNCDPESAQTNHTEPDRQTPQTSDSFQQVFCIEDRLWTEKFSPQHSRDIVGNSAPLTKLHSWLKRWKLRTNPDKRRKTERKKEEKSLDSWDCGDFQGEAGSEVDQEEPLWNAVLITGPPGVGKTASVYACAQEFGFKVFEVNCSSQRSGRRVLSQLKEATQSHLVEASGKDLLKPAYVNTGGGPQSEPLPGKTAQTVPSVSRQRATRSWRCSAGKVRAKPATATLAHYFKTKAKANGDRPGGLPPPEEADRRTPDNSSLGPDQTSPQKKQAATSLILFEEVDVVFDDDVGFFAAIKAFMTTTKRPVVLTTNDPSFSRRFGCRLEEIIYKPPSAASACRYLQLVCLAEKLRVDVEDVGCLLRLCSGDVRRCLLQLQLWLQGGRAGTAQSGGGSESQLHSGCSASMLGLQSATPQFLLKHLKCPSWPETELEELLTLLAESWRRGLPLLYTNLELLLDTVMLCGLQMEPSLPLDDVKIQQRKQKTSPNVSVQRVKNISKLSRRKNISAFDASSSPNPTHEPPRASARFNTEQRAAQTVAECVDALADFFDLMSCLNSSLPAVGRLSASETFVWTGSELKDGLLDEPSEEHGGSWSRETLLPDIQAAVEGLGCRRCWRRVCAARTEAQSYRQQLDDQRWKTLMERLAVKSSSGKTNLSFSVQPLCAARRLELSRTVLSSKYFSLQGNREAVGVDYMPLLRFICRSHAAGKHTEEPEGCFNYLSRKRLGISKSTVRLLAEEF
ncbi:ATPase family AAA domain-containing protein 5b isoform X2 [Salarias fasciatus]|uniref:ATPase family AAA domain-containing protein 5b isoform X2 n=1 Tax=Salarias fasciatus TaxID=181472 RepID=UPI001176EBAD|nr:ATPase family AAA domain-containing protein 5-like isoform X2 [Salarias fasciatus]